MKFLLYFGFSAFALYFPLQTLCKKELTLKLSVPVSISTQIIFGYFFYCFGKISLYPLFYFTVIVLLNILVLIKTQPNFKKTFKSNWKQVLAVTIFFALLVFHFFYDSLSTCAPGTIDTTHHINYLFKDLHTYGYLNFPTYPPGFHILLYPLTFISSPIQLYRFAGPVMGLITVFFITLTYKDIFKHKVSIVVFVSLLLLPIFNQLTLQLIGFFPTALSFLFVIFLILIITEQKIFLWVKWVLSIVVLSSLGITIPYLTIQLIPCFVVLLIFSFFNYKVRNLKIYKSIAIATIGLIFSFVFAFMHVYIQGSILKRTSGFPAIETAKSDNGSMVIKTTYQQKDDLVRRLPETIRKIAQTPFAENYILPMALTGTDIIKIKNIRPLNNALSIGAYGMIVVALATVIIKSKRVELAIISVLVIVFGISTQTGILEISTYRGRSGYYMLLFSIILITCLVDQYLKYIKKYHKPLFVIIFLSVALSLIHPPTYYRIYYPEYFEITREILNQHKGKNILIKTNMLALSSLSPMIKTENLSENTDLNKCDSDKCFLMLEKKYLHLDPVLSQSSYAADKEAVNFLKTQGELAQAQDALTKRIMESPEIKNANKYFENENIVIYETSRK